MYLSFRRLATLLFFIKERGEREDREEGEEEQLNPSEPTTRNVEGEFVGMFRIVLAESRSNMTTDNIVVCESPETGLITAMF